MRQLRFLIFGAVAVMLTLAPARAEDSEIEQFNEKIQAQFAARDFNALEALAVELRKDNAYFTGGFPRLHAFYRALAGQPLSGDYWLDWASNSPIVAFDDRCGLLESWQQAKSDSIVPRIALGLLWRFHAWEGRGSGFSNQVSPEQLAKFREGLLKEQESLRGIDPTDPTAYYALITLARDESWPRSALDSLYRSAVAKYPTYFPFYVQRARVLQPKWFGKPGELKEYAQSLLKDPGGDLGEIEYSIVTIQQVLESDLWSWSSEFFDKTGLAWAKVKAGFEHREQRYGLSKADWNLLLYLAAAALDRATALKAVGRIGDDWAPWLWQDKKTYSDTVGWARTVNPNDPPAP